MSLEQIRGSLQHWLSASVYSTEWWHHLLKFQEVCVKTLPDTGMTLHDLSIYLISFTLILVTFYKTTLKFALLQFSFGFSSNFQLQIYKYINMYVHVCCVTSCFIHGFFSYFNFLYLTETHQMKWFLFPSGSIHFNAFKWGEENRSPTFIFTNRRLKCMLTLVAVKGLAIIPPNLYSVYPLGAAKALSEPLTRWPQKGLNWKWLQTEVEEDSWENNVGCVLCGERAFLFWVFFLLKEKKLHLHAFNQNAFFS